MSPSQARSVGQVCAQKSRASWMKEERKNTQAQMKWMFVFFVFFHSFYFSPQHTSLFMICEQIGDPFPSLGVPLSSQACAHKAAKRKCPTTTCVILISHTPFLSTLPFLFSSDSDDSDHEGESHVSRVLREYSDKKKIEELDRMPITSPLSSNSSAGSNYRNRSLRDAIRQEHGTNNNNSPTPTSLASSASSNDYLVRSRRARGETGHQPSRSEDASSAPSAPLRPIRTREIGQKPAGTLSPPESPASATLPTPTSPNTPSSSSASLETPRIGNRFRTSSDASLSAALGRLEGKRNQDALVAQVSHLGSTRARSPHRGNRAYREHIDVAPPPPLPTPKSDYRQQRQPLTPPSSSGSPSNTLRSSPSLPSLSSSSSSSRRNGQPVDLGAYGQRQQQQQTQQQQARYF